MSEEATMAEKSAALAAKLEAKLEAALATLDEVSEAEWRKVTEAEQWPVGVTAHHYASALEPIAQMIKAVVVGQVPGKLTRGMIDEMNARHAKDCANCTKTETIELLERGGALAVATVRELSDAQLAKRGTVLTDVPPMTAEELIAAALLAHLDEHFGSIRKTLGR
jgi:DinB superfamily